MNWIKICRKKHPMRLIFAGLMIIFLCTSFAILNFSSVMSPGIDIDDQRSAMWPMLTSSAVTMLGTLITTYVFLKGALDRTLDEKPYYRLVINKYRKKIVRQLWGYACVWLFYILLIFVLYFYFYFEIKRSPDIVRRTLVILYFAGFLFSAYILYGCIYIEKGLNNTALGLLDDTLKRMKNCSRDIYSLQVILNLGGANKRDKADLRVWLQIQEDGGSHIDSRRFISRFSEWETLLLLLVEQKASTMGQYFQEAQLESLIKNCIDINQQSGRDGIEWEDAKANGWFSNICERIRACERELSRSARELSNGNRLSDKGRRDPAGNPDLADCLMDEFLILAQCRNLLQSLVDTESDSKDLLSPHQNWLDGYEESLAEIFFSFVIGLSVAIFRISPRIETFSPSSRFYVSDFYSVRFENSSFRASWFSYAIFARTKVNNSNFSLCKLESCEFFSADFRDCSFSNTYWENCSLRETIFHYVDFTGAALRQCGFENASFHSAILLNMTLDTVVLDGNDLQDCKIDNVTLHLHWNSKGQILLRGCNFSDSSITRISLILDNKPAVCTGDYQDPAVTALQNSIASPAIQEALCSGLDQKNRFPAMMDAFSLEHFPFIDHQCINKAQKKIPTHPIWTYIKKMTVIFMEESIFNNAVMPSFRFYRTNLEQSVFRNTQMNNARLFCVYMPGCIMPDANLRQSRLWAVVLQSAALEDAIFFKAICRLVNFEDAAMQHLHASEARMQYCTFNRSDCRNIDLTRARVEDSQFWDSILTEAEFTGSEFYSVQFDSAVADHMLASYTLFQSCSLINAYLSNSNFNYTVFEDCNFRLADFSGSTFTSTIFRRCDFAGSNFSETCFIEAVFENCSHLGSASFENCRMISPDFRGTNSQFAAELPDGAIYNLVD